MSTPKPKNKGGRPKLDKVTVSIRLSRNVLAQARQASARGGNLSAWIEQAIEAQLNDKAHKAFFTKHPLVPGGDDVLKGLLKERAESP